MRDLLLSFACRGQLAAGAAQLVALEHMCASENSKSAVNTLGAAATIHLKEVLCVFK